MTIRHTIELVKSAERSAQPVTPSDLIMAWAVDQDTGHPRYILQLDASHRGKKSNCKCPSCDAPLVAVNAAKAEFQIRPHFRHPKGAARERCIIVAARKALAEILGKQDQLILPRRRRSQNIEGLSGHYFDAWVERPAETVRVNECHFRDETTATLTLDDGRRLIVQLVGRGVVTQLKGDEAILAQIELEIDDPAIAMMSPDEIFKRLELAWSNACWTQHWADSELDNLAQAKAREIAAAALDWLESDHLSDEMNPIERRETLLHREVKIILERERRIRLPGLNVEAKWQRDDGFVDQRSWSTPDTEVSLTTVELEVHLGRSVPDVIASWINSDGWSQSIFIEVTVTNPIGSERIDRLSSFGFPVLEIDIGRMGGIVTRDEFTRLVVDEVAGKHWLYHPSLDEEKQHLLDVMKREAEEAAEAARKLQSIMDVSASDWAQRFLSAFRKRWSEQLIVGEGETGIDWQKVQDELLEAIQALEVHGYLSASLIDQDPLRTIIARVLSIKLGTGVEYKFDNAWAVINAIRCDRGPSSLKWHTLFLIAIRTYQPTLNTEQTRSFVQWRDMVKTSIENEESTYVRDTVYDRLLGLLFPEMRPALSKPFGTPLQVLDKDYDAQEFLPASQPNRFRTSDDSFLRGRQFDEWARRNPDSAKTWLESPAEKQYRLQQRANESNQNRYGQWKRKRT